MKLNNLCQKILCMILFFVFSAFAEDKINNNPADNPDNSIINQVVDKKEEPIVFVNTGNVQLLNKNTAKVEKIFLQIKQPITINNLEIVLHKCWQAPAYQKPESKMLLEVSDIYKNKKTLIFFGWLFSSSPSLSSLEHPIYDLIALNCLKK